MKFKIKKQLSNKIARREAFKFKNYKIQELRNIVLRAQMEIAVDLRNGDVTSASKRINKFVRSETARAYAVYQTISKKGYRSKGFSEYKPKTNVQYAQLISDLWNIVKKPHLYKAKPLKRIYIPKPKGGLRPISVPSYLDRALQHLYRFIFDVFQEETADPSSFGFRSFRSPGWASKAITLSIWQRKAYGPPKYAIELDIAKCFDSFDHNFILNNIGNFTIHGSKIRLIPHHILNQWLKCGFIDANDPWEKLQETTGVPQGGPISPIISNMILNGFESAILNKISQIPPSESPPPTKKANTPMDGVWVFKFRGEELFCNLPTSKNIDIDNIIDNLIPDKKARKQKITWNITQNSTPDRPRMLYGWTAEELKVKAKTKLYYQRLADNESWSAAFRFADDAIVLCNTEAAIAAVFEAAEEFLTPRGLKLNKEKTLIKHIRQESFDFVGFTYKLTSKNKIYNFPPIKKVKGLITKIRQILNPSRSIESCIEKLNPLIRGWCNYYCVGNSSDVFSLIKFRLWHLFYNFLWKKYRKLSLFKSKSGKNLDKYKLSGYIWKKHTKFYKGNNHWWYLNKNARKGHGRAKKLDLFLFNPQVPVSTPSIIIYRPNSNFSLNAYNPEDRMILQEKALYWKHGFLGRALIEQKGKCSLCSCDLLDDQTSYEIHHVLPIKFGGKFKLSNIRILCKSCHQDVTKAVAQKDISLLTKYQGLKIISGDVLTSLQILDKSKNL